MSLRLVDLTCGYGKMVVVESANLEVAQGEIVVILGPNGAGKTTLLKTVAGLLRPISGRIYLNGTDITGLSPLKRVEMGITYIPDRDSAFRSLSVKDNLLLALRDGELDLDLFPQLVGRLNDRAGNLSGGQFRMLSLAIAYHMRPKLLLLDEPSSGLAPRAKDEIARLLLAMRERGITMVVAEQDAEFATVIADRIVLMESGLIKDVIRRSDFHAISFESFI